LGAETPELIATKFCTPVPSITYSRLPILVKIGQGVLALQWVEFLVFPLTCVVAVTTLARDRAFFSLSVERLLLLVDPTFLGLAVVSANCTSPNASVGLVIV